MSLSSLFCWDATGVARATGCSRPAFMASLRAAAAGEPRGQTVMVVTEPVAFMPAVESDGCMVSTIVPSRFVSDVSCVRTPDVALTSLEALAVGVPVEIQLPCGTWVRTAVCVVVSVTPDWCLRARSGKGRGVVWHLDTLFAPRHSRTHGRPPTMSLPPPTVLLKAMAADEDDALMLDRTDYDLVRWDIEDDSDA